MDEYISRTELVRNLDRFAPEHFTDLIRSLIMKQPTADVVEVKHGEWIPIVKQDNYLEPPYCDTIKCSECGEEADVSFHDAKYCYRCGTKMDGRRDA